MGHFSMKITPIRGSSLGENQQPVGQTRSDLLWRPLPKQLSRIRFEQVRVDCQVGHTANEREKPNGLQFRFALQCKNITQSAGYQI
jgi:hypothetical protein